MLILKQNAANTVPTPPAGKGTIFLNPSDDLAVKTADGNITVFPTAAGANTQVYFNDDGSFGATANFTFNKSTNVLTISGNVAATRILTDNLLYANGTAWDLSDPGGSNTQIQFNDDESFGGSAAFTFDKSSNLVTVSANLNSNNLNATTHITSGNVWANSGIISAQTLKGEGGNISNIQGANVSGAVASATSAGSATTAGTVTTAAQPNITSVGTLSSVSVTGNAIAGNVYANSGTIGAQTLKGEGGNISNIQGANVSGTVSSATTAGTVTTAAQPNITSVGTLSSVDVTGNAIAGNVYANSGTIGAGTLKGEGGNISNIQGANVSGTVSSATTAGTVTTAAQPNITSVGTLTSVAITGNATAGNVYANSGTIGASLLTGTLTTAAQPNITSVGTLTSLSATGNVTAGNVYANSGTIGAQTLKGEGGNISNIQGANVSGAVASATSATTAGTVTTAAQPNITSVGTLSSVSVTGNVAAGNLTTTGVLTVSGTGTSSIAGNLDMTGNTIANLATPSDPADAATKQYVDDIAQGLHTHDSCGAATPDTLANITGGTITYNNGTAGVGANLVTTGTFNLIDGVNVQTAGTRILVKNEANSAHNGIYVWSNATVITRASDFDTPAEMAGGDFTFVNGGTLYDNTGWVMTDAVTTVGTSPVPWVQFSGAGTYTAGTGLTLNGSQFNISNTTVTAASYGNGDRVASFTVNAQGQLTAASNVVIAANAANLTGSTLASGITTSSLTTVGTLGSLAVTGNATAGNVYANSGTIGASLLTGTLTTAAQPNITSVGTLTSASVTGNVTAGNVYANSGTIGATNLTGTLTTAAQPNITSVGTLTSLSVTGNITGGNLIGPVANGNSSLTIPAAAGNVNISVNGTANVAVITATGVNVAGTLNATGNANVGNIGATRGVFTNIAGEGGNISNIQGANVSGTVATATTAGTVTTAAQPNITSVGTLTSLSVTGNVSAGNVSGTLLTGTLTTAAQPNITSVGTLTSLTSSGNISGANIVSTAYQVASVAGAVSAAGTVQGNATAITAQINVVSTVASGAGVILPNVPAGVRITIVNTSANALLVYPASGEAINSLATNAAYSQPAGARLDYLSTSATQYYTLNATYG